AQAPVRHALTGVSDGCGDTPRKKHCPHFARGFVDGETFPRRQIRHRNELCGPLATSFIKSGASRMGLFDWISRLFGGGDQPAPEAAPPAATRPGPAVAPARRDRRHRRIRLAPLRAGRHPPKKGTSDAVGTRPYRFARPAVQGGWLDLSQDEDQSRLQRFQLPQFRQPEELARWLGIPLGQLAWLVHRFEDDQRPSNESAAHYVYRWIKKR